MIKLAFAPPEANELDLQIRSFSGVRSLLLPTKCSGMSSAFGMPSHTCAGRFGAEGRKLRIRLYTPPTRADFPRGPHALVAERFTDR